MKKLWYVLMVLILMVLPCFGFSADNSQATKGFENVQVSEFISLSEGKTAQDFGAETVLIVHYQRPDGKYEHWNLWIWPSKPVSKEGNRYLFEAEDDFGKYAIITFDEKHTELGFIVRTDNWDKDISVDRFITIPESGVAEIWVLSGIENYYVDPSTVDLSPRVLAAIMDSFDEIHLELTVPFDTKDWQGKVNFYMMDETTQQKFRFQMYIKTDPTDVSLTTKITVKLQQP